MTDLSNLSPAVREAVERCDRGKLVAFSILRRDYDTIRAELLRLAGRKPIERVIRCIDCPHDLGP